MTADPTQPLAGAMAGGLGALIVAEIGLPPGMLALSFLAACVGLLFAPKGRSRYHDLLVFVGVVFCGAWLGVAFAPLLAAQVPMLAHPEKVLVILIGILFHPLFNLAAARLPAAADKLGLRKTNPQDGASQ